MTKKGAVAERWLRQPLCDLTIRFAKAVRRIVDGKALNNEVRELIRSLELFNKGRLNGVVLPSVSESVPIGESRRASFKKRLATEGEVPLFREFLEKLTPQMRTALRRASCHGFRHILLEDEVLCDYDWRRDQHRRYGWGARSAKKFEEI